MLRKTVLIRALQLAFSAAALSTVAINPAMAQSNAAGVIFGKAAPGSSVVLKNLDTNQTRTVTADSQGKFSVSGMALGRWQVTTGGQTTVVEAIAGQGAEATFAGEAAVQSVQTVQIAGRRSRIDVSNATNGAVFTATELARLPVARNVDAIIQLAPNTTKGDPTYAAGASFAGGGVSENAYYINGFPTTNPLTQLGASELPFGAIAQASVLVGGFGAEFGRSVGGVVNITGKSGTNRWEAGAMASITPRGMRANFVDRNFGNTGATPNAATDGTLRIRREDNRTQNTQYGVYVGGPIIKDKVFMFAAAELSKQTRDLVALGRTSTALSTGGFLNEKTDTERYYGKIDWNITDNHRLEFTALGDTPEVISEYHSYNYTTRKAGPAVTSSLREKGNTLNNPNGGDVRIARYTGNFTDNLTVTGLYGESKVKKLYEPGGYNANLFSVNAPANAQAPGLNYNSPQSFTGSIPLTGATDEIKFARVDFEYKLGSHLIRFGADDIEVASRNAGDVTAGGGQWVYNRSTSPGTTDNLQGVTLPILSDKGPLAAQGFYVNRNLYSTASNSFSYQNAFYIEDKWSITKNILLSLGVRSESFSNANSENKKFVEIKNQITPRVNVAWDVNGDSSLKAFASAGRYAIQIPNVVALRAANGSLNTSQYFAYTGTDANGLPTGLTQLTEAYSTNNEYGQAKDVRVVADQNIKPAYQDEITFGFEKTLTPTFNIGTKLTHRSLKSTLDDVCDDRPAQRYAARTKTPISPKFHGACAIFNTGEGGAFFIDFMGDGKLTLAELTEQDLGFEKVKRTYTALDFFAEHPFRNGWYGRINYTLARSRGNTEGQTRSDGNAGQGDVAQTATSDYPEYDFGAYGNLPNDRRHQIKAYGFYEVSPQWMIGANVLVASGRPNGCTGKNPAPVAGSPNYSSERYCGGTQGFLGNVLTPRGTTGRLPWERNLDLNVTWRPEGTKGFAFKMDVFNVFDKQTVLRTNEQLNTGAGAVSNLYGAVTANSGPRAFKFTAQYDHKF